MSKKGRPRRMTDEQVAEARRLFAAGKSQRAIAVALKVPRRTIRRALEPEGKEYLLSREASLLRNYGITLADYTTTLAAQGGCCWICRRPPAEGQVLHVDHHHPSGTVR